MKMSKLYFRYGTMDSSKTARLLMDAHEYIQRGEEVLLLKPSDDDRWDNAQIVSRIGLKGDCVVVGKSGDVYNVIANLNFSPACILVDEAQFFTEEQILQLRRVADRLDIPVMCYGLKVTFQGKLFEGSKALFENANVIEEVKTICRAEGCRNKAMYNVRYVNGKPVLDGDIVEMGDTAESNEIYYLPKCSIHFFNDISKANSLQGGK